MAQRHYVFTVQIEHDTEEQVQILRGDDTLPPKIRYATWQVERAPTTGQLHLQGYVEFKSPVRIPQAKRLLNSPGAHLEPRRGTREQARDYAQKEESRVRGPFEVGIWEISPGKRSDLDAVKNALVQGASLAQISDDHFGAFLRYHRGIRAWKLLHAVRREWPMEVVVLWGPTGTGKTRAAWDLAPTAYGLPPSQGGSGVGWWDGYDGHETVIIDEFYGWLKYSFFLQLLDRYPLRLETKGGSVECQLRRVILTSNKPPEEWYDGAKFPFPPIDRRLSRVIKCDHDLWYVQKR